jgi:hypothetical protein
MSRACTICTHRNRLDVDVALLRGDSERAIGARFGATKSSVNRHRAHVERPESGTLPRSMGERDRQLDMRAEVFWTLDEAKRLGAVAEKAEDYPTAMRMIREVTRILELVTSKIPVGPRGPETLTDVQLSQRIAALRQKLLGAA